MTQRDTGAAPRPERAVLPPHRHWWRRRRWISSAAATTGVILAGVGLVGCSGDARSDQQSHRHFITVTLDPEVTAEQRAAVETKLQGWNPTVGPEFKNPGDVASAASEVYQDDPEALEQATALPAMIVMTIESPRFDCEPVPALLKLPGVQNIMIDGVKEPDGQFGRIACP